MKLVRDLRLTIVYPIMGASDNAPTYDLQSIARILDPLGFVRNHVVKGEDSGIEYLFAFYNNGKKIAIDYKDNLTVGYMIKLKIRAFDTKAKIYVIAERIA